MRTISMQSARVRFGTRAQQTAVALVAAGLLVAGVTWRGVAASSQANQAKAAQQAPAAQPSLSHSFAGGRDSYADVVKAVAPSVVTIRTEGRANAAPTGFDDEEDLFRRFFGDQFNQRQPRPFGPRQQPRTFRQRALGSGVVMSSD